MNTKNTPANKMTGVRMTGGIDIDVEEMKTLPEANYWQMGAKWAREQMYKMIDSGIVPEEKIDDILSRYWHNGNTWMRICTKTEHALDLIKALVNNNQGEIR